MTEMWRGDSLRVSHVVCQHGKPEQIRPNKRQSQKNHKMEAPFTAKKPTLLFYQKKVCTLFSAVYCGSVSGIASDL